MWLLAPPLRFDLTNPNALIPTANLGAPQTQKASEVTKTWTKTLKKHGLSKQHVRRTAKSSSRRWWLRCPAIH
eukprot:g40769.t1